MYYQQGDVIIEKVAEIRGKKLNHLILAMGETTGHCHQVSEGEAELYEHDGVVYLRIKSEVATIIHEEHKTVTLPKGDYVVRQVQEYDHFSEEARNVRD